MTRSARKHSPPALQSDVQASGCTFHPLEAPSQEQASAISIASTLQPPNQARRRAWLVCNSSHLDVALVQARTCHTTASSRCIPPSQDGKQTVTTCQRARISIDLIPRASASSLQEDAHVQLSLTMKRSSNPSRPSTTHYTVELSDQGSLGENQDRVAQPFKGNHHSTDFNFLAPNHRI